MDTKKQKRFSRKRKRETTNQEVAQRKNKVFDKRAHAEEEELSKDLFGDNSGFFKSLEELEINRHTTFGSDSGVGETESEESNDDNKRKPVWHDDDDDGIDVGGALNAQGRSLPSGGINDRASKYSDLLAHKFNSLVGTPKWASLDKSHAEDDSDEELLQSCGHIAKSQTRSLPSSTLEYKKVQDLNIETYNEGPKISTVEFHPSCTVALVAGVSGVASLIAVDGKRNNKLHSVAFTRYMIECARFINDGMEALLGSNQRHFFSYDLRAAKTLQVPLPHGLTHCCRFEVSPNRNIIAVVGKYGEVHLLSSASKELISTLKQNTTVTALTFNADGSQLFGHSDTGEVTVWDIGSRRIQHKWTDEGCLRGTSLAVSPSGQLLAAGSAQGVVNLYDMEHVLQAKNPKPRKAIMNLTTSIGSLRFNSTSEILGLASNNLANSVRLFHVPSGTVFNNFPQFGTKLGRVNTFSFSPSSGYLALANFNSTVALYRLKHYNNY